MGFFCVQCNKKVRGQPSRHGHTRRKFGKHANNRVSKMAPSSKGLICFDLRDRGQCSNLQNCFFSHKFKGTGRVCKPFVDKGMCTNFNKCLYSHPKDRRGAGNWGTHWADDNPPSAKGLICFDLRDRGQCDFQNCWFSHDFKGTGTGCKPFVDKGMCTNFKTCLNSHPKDRRGAGNEGA